MSVKYGLIVQNYYHEDGEKVIYDDFTEYNYRDFCEVVKRLTKNHTTFRAFRAIPIDVAIEEIVVIKELDSN